MADNGEEKLIAVARHIAKTLGRTDTMTDDILQIFSNFDGRFSREKLAVKRGDDGAGADDDHMPAFSNLERNLQSLDRQISSYVAGDRPIWSDSGDSAAFLDAVDSLVNVMRDLDPVIPGDKPLLDRAEGLLNRAMLRLEDEFKYLIEKQIGGSPPSDPIRAPYDSDGDDSDGDDRIPIGHPVTDYEIVIDALPPGTIADLREIAKRMVAAGFGKECAHAYSISRRSFLEESISRLGLLPRTIEEVQGTPWPDLEEEIGRWTRAANVAVRILFPSERRLCDRVLAGLGPIADLSFVEVSHGPAFQLLRFADAVSVGSKAPERLFRIVDMYESLRDLIPEIDAVFSDQYSAAVRSESTAICKRLGVAIRGVFTELENLIRRDPARAAVPGGGLHPITRYVMNYLRAACASRGTLEEVMEEEGIPAAVDRDRPSSSSLSVQISWIMEVLQGNLDAKAKVYRDPALSFVFLINNGRYIIQKVKGSGDLGLLLGDDWIRRQMARVRQWNTGYQRNTWSRVISALRIDLGGGGGAGSSAAATAKAVREKFRAFNAYLEEIHRAQTGWVVADEQMKEELQISAVQFVVPPYRNFLGRFRSVVEAGKHSEKFLKYSADDVEARIGELFQGTTGRKL